MLGKASVSPQIWYARVGDENEQFEHSVLELLSSSELKRLDRIKSNSKRREYLLSRALMRHALSYHFKQAQNEWIFVEQSNSPPKVSNLPADYWLSLSHSHGAICFAISRQAVGIDIERSGHRQNFSALAKVFMNSDELALLHSQQQLMADTFYRIWCAKEAFYKITPKADQENLFFKKIAYIELAAGSSGFSLTAGNIDEHYLALVTQSMPANIDQTSALTFQGSIPIRWRRE